MRLRLYKKKVIILVAFVIVAIAGILYMLVFDNMTNTTNMQANETSNSQEYKPFASEETDKIVAEATQLVTTKGEPGAAVIKIEEYLASGKGNDKEKAFMNATAANYYFVYGNDQPKALELYQKAIELRPNDPTWYAAIGRMYFIAGDTQEANKYFQQALDTYDTKLPSDYSGEGREYYTKLLEGKDPYLNLLKGEQR
jgi:tetratricopeptide (TPR) repeat protein